MRTFQRILSLGALACVLCLSWVHSTQAQLITSWEGDTGSTAGTPDGLDDPNGWIVPSGQNATLTIASDPGMAAGDKGVTDGDQSLSISFTGTNTGGGITHFARPVQWNVPNPSSLFDLFTTVAAAPAIYRLNYDVTVDPALLPTFNNLPAEDTAFMSVGTYASSGTFGESYNNVIFGPDDVTGIATFNAEVNVNDLKLVADAGFYQLGFNINGNWDLNDDITLYVDNLRFELVAPDLNQDTVVNQADWTIFMANHKGDLSTLTPEEQFLAGDLDGDGDNDFQDYVSFEQGYDTLNGSGSFAAMVASVPEPSTLLLGLLTVAGIASLRNRRSARLFAMLLTTLVGAALSTSVQAQQLSTFETDLDGWVTVDFGLPNVVLDRSGTGATEGSFAMSITQPEDGYSNNAQVTYGGGTDGYNAFANAIDVGATVFELQFDVTYDTASIPQVENPSFTNVSIALNSNAGWSPLDYSVANSNGQTDETINVAIPLSDFPALPATGADGGYYQINLGMNGDWGLDPATLYFDNFRLVQTASAPRLTLNVDRSTGAVTLSNATGESLDMDYYEITSAANSLAPGGWSSLDDQDLDSSGSGSGESWLEGGNPTASDLTEAYLLGMSSIADGGAPIALGDIYNSGVDAQDLLFKYRDPARPAALLDGNVVYTGAPSLSADFDNDTDVDDADLGIWAAAYGTNANGDADADLDSDGADFLAWQRQFTGPGAATPTAGVIPEPSTCWLALAGCLFFLRERLRKS